MYAIIISILIFVLFSFYFFGRDPNYTVTRSKFIPADTDKVFKQIIDLKLNDTWNPWAIHEENNQTIFSENTDEVGSWYTWDGKLIGSGKLTNVGIEYGLEIGQIIEFYRPFRTISAIQWKFEPEENGVKVTWSLRGKMPFFLSYKAGQMIELLGKDFELGLDLLCGELMGGDHKFAITFGEEKVMSGGKYISDLFEGHKSTLKQASDKKFERLYEEAGESLDTERPSMTIHYSTNEKTGFVSIEVAVPVLENYQGKINSKNFVESVLCSSTILKGNHKFLTHAWWAAFGHHRMMKYKPSDSAKYEVYLTPKDTPENDSLTELLIPIL